MSVDTQRMDRLINNAMSNAAENGYTGELAQLDDEQMAIDLGSYDSELEGYELDALISGVRRWRNKK